MPAPPFDRHTPCRDIRLWRAWVTGVMYARVFFGLACLSTAFTAGNANSREWAVVFACLAFVAAAAGVSAWVRRRDAVAEHVSRRRCACGGRLRQRRVQAARDQHRAGE